MSLQKPKCTDCSHVTSKSYMRGLHIEAIKKNAWEDQITRVRFQMTRAKAQMNAWKTHLENITHMNISIGSCHCRNSNCADFAQITSKGYIRELHIWRFKWRAEEVKWRAWVGQMTRVKGSNDAREGSNDARGGVKWRAWKSQMTRVRGQMTRVRESNDARWKVKWRAWKTHVDNITHMNKG